MGRRQTEGDDLPADLRDSAHLQLALLLQVGQRQPFQERHHDERRAIDFVGLMDRDDVIVFELREQPRLPKKRDRFQWW